MPVYFVGRRLRREFSTDSPNGRERVAWRVFEEWRDIDQGTVVRCGNPGECKIEVAQGVTDSAIETLREVAGGTLGMKDVFSLKAEVETSLGHEITWSVSHKVIKTFPVEPAPRCGRTSLTVYQLFRVYELTFYRKNWLSFDRDKWAKLHTRTVQERTGNHDGMPDTVDWDSQCNCGRDPVERTYDGLAVIAFGPTSLRVPYRITPGGLEVQIARSIVTFPSDDISAVARGMEFGLGTEIPASVIPAPLRFLGKIEEHSQVSVAISRFGPDDTDDTDQGLLQAQWLTAGAEARISSLDFDTKAT
jgi:hypothetical protein